MMNIMIMGSIAGAGKSTAAAYLTRNYKYYEISVFIHLLKLCGFIYLQKLIF